MDCPVSAVVQTYQRPENLAAQIARLRPQVDEILVSHAENERTPEFDFSAADKVIRHSFRAPRQKLTAALASRNAHIAIFDDDMMPGSKWISVVQKYWWGQPAIYGGAGCYRDPTSWRGYTAYWPWEHEERLAYVDWVGGAIFLDRWSLGNIVGDVLPVDVFSGSDDIWVGFRAWECGVSCIVTPAPCGRTDLWGIEARPQAQGDMAIHRSYGRHEQDRMDLIAACEEQGWPRGRHPQYQDRTIILSV